MVDLIAKLMLYFKQPGPIDIHDKASLVLVLVQVADCCVEDNFLTSN